MTYRVTIRWTDGGLSEYPRSANGLSVREALDEEWARYSGRVHGWDVATLTVSDPPVSMWVLNPNRTARSAAKLTATPRELASRHSDEYIRQQIAAEGPVGVS